MPASQSNLTKLCGSCGYRLEASLMRCPVDGSRLSRERSDVAILGSYRLVERLGTGGMGVVYRAIHEKLARTVAIKVLNRAMLSDRTNVARFFQEARSVNTIRHPNVVDIHDFVTAGKDIYMVMEFLVGRDLHQGLYDQGGKPFSPDRAVNILEQICGALQAAHDRNIIHRDLKPANIYLSRRGDVEDFVKLLDFGLAKLERSEGRMTREGVVLGTPEYMAPEQARGDSLDSRTDIYAVGCIAYHMLTGVQLFAGGAYADVMVRHVKETPPQLRAINPGLPAPLEATVLGCLSKKAETRPASPRALAEQLAAAIGRPFDQTGSFASGRPRAPSPSISVVHSPVSIPQIVSRTLQLHSPRRRWVAAGGLLAVAATAGLVAVIKPRSTTSAPNAASARPTPSGPALQPSVRVLLQSNPPGAEIFNEKNASIGVTPHLVFVPFGSHHRVDFVLAGYRRAHRSFRADVDTTVAEVLEREGSAPAAEPKTGERPTRRRATRRAEAESSPAPQDLDSRARTINPFQR